MLAFSWLELDSCKPRISPYNSGVAHFLHLSRLAGTGRFALGIISQQT